MHFGGSERANNSRGPCANWGPHSYSPIQQNVDLGWSDRDPRSDGAHVVKPMPEHKPWPTGAHDGAKGGGPRGLGGVTESKYNS